MTIRSSRLTAVLLVPLLLITVRISAGEIRDDGNFFSPEQIQRAATQLSSMEQKYGLGVDIETYKTVPADENDRYVQLGKNEFFHQWMQQRAKAKNTSGVFILISRDPSHLQVGLGHQAIDKGLTIADRDAIRDSLLADFKNKNYDAGLDNALATIEQRFSDASRTHATSAGPAPTHRGGDNYGSGTTTAPVPTPRHSIVGSVFKFIFLVALVGLIFLGFVIWFIYHLFRRAFGGAGRPATDVFRGGSGSSGGGDF